MSARYQILNRIATTAGSQLYRAMCPANAAPVVLKLSEPENFPTQAARLRREYAILRALDIPGVIKPNGLIDEPGRFAMVLDNFDGQALDSLLDQHRPDVSLCLRIGIQLARILAGLHAARLVHRDIRPANLMLLSDGTICLVDLSLATMEPAQTASAAHPLVGDWAYIAPEQTGRMNRLVDYRADFYGLGVTLYRMLTGQLPCQGKDALEWAHCHLAIVPCPPSDVNPAIPSVLSDIVQKLLEKMPEDRYQSAHGLQFDLEQCLAQRDANGTIPPFALATQDMSEHFRIPQKLVGREAELRQLLASFDAMAASGHTALLLISGSAGVGKSALVCELREPIMERHGYFISGKFDQYQREIPYATVTQAFRELVQQILAENEAGIAAWRRQIQDAVGANGQLIADVLPQVELIIGPQAPVPRLPPAEAQNRYRMVFQKFVGVFAQQAHPLTLFLDDWQWADSASLRLVSEMLSSPERRFLLVIGAYRDNELGLGHPLTLALDALRTEGAAMTQIALGPLSEAALGTFIDATLHGEPGAAASLARIVYQKTAGNPFFMIQFISALAEERLIAFDAGSRAWRWDLARISAKGYTDNVAEFMVAKLARLPSFAQAVLQRLACLGSGAQEATLMRVSGQPEEATQAALALAASAGLVLRADSTIRFLHDWVQEAAYMSMSAAARTTMHLHIGRLLMAGKTEAQIEEAVFSIVSQFNRGADGIVDAGDKRQLCHLNFLAGKKAKAAIAYTSARSFFDRALALAPADAWQTQYQETLALTLALSECEYLVGHFERAEQLTKLILANARARRDSALVYRLRMELCQMAGRYEDALASMFEAARLFGMIFPVAGPEIEAAIDAEIRAIELALHDRPVGDVADAPPLADADMAMMIAFIAEAIPAAYMSRPDYFALIVARAVRLSLCYGPVEDSSYAFSVYGIVLLARGGDMSLALEFSAMALRLNQNLDGRRLKGRLLTTEAIAFSPLKSFIANSTSILDQAFAACLEVGDLVYANYSVLLSFWPMLQQGVPLEMVLATARRHAAFARASHNEPVCQAIRLQQHLAANLMGTMNGQASPDAEHFDEARCFAVLEEARFGFAIEASYILKQAASFIYGDYAGALAAARQKCLTSHEAGSLILVDAVHHFYFALTLAALYPQASAEEQGRYAAMLAGELELHRRWAGHCPQNFLHRHALVDAEIARIEGRASDAERLYEQAIRSAHENGFIHTEAIAFELASNFYRARGFALFADTYLREARDGYLRWGADGKVAQLDERHPQLLWQTAGAPPPALFAHDVTRLDLLSVAKASQAISGRIVLPELVDTLLHIVLENAGAQSAYLLLVRKEALVLTADARVEQQIVQVHLHLETASPDVPLPASVVNYVRRSRQQVLLPDAAQPNPFSGDPYFFGRLSKSVLCLPILRQDALIGLLYLENDLITHAFTPDRLAVLALLASQAAISLQNACLYTDLQEREARIRRLVESNIVAIMFYDLAGNITGANDAALAMLGYSRQELLDGKIRWADMTPVEWRAADERAVAELRATGTCQPFEKEYVRKDGMRVPVLIAGALFEGSPDQGVAFALDLSASKRAEEQIRHLADHDALTGLPNRVLLQDRLKLAIAAAHRHQNQVAILFIDLDYFKNINDSLGHHIGDIVLQDAAVRLQKCLREGDSVARLGGDEFVLSLPLLADSSDAALVAHKALDALAQPFFVEGHELHVSGSIGISVYPNDGTDTETLMRAADTAMYHAKGMGRGNFQFFTDALNVAAQQRFDVGTRLRHALTHGEFVLHYQPQVDMASGMTFSVEALLRWQPAGEQPISCGAFIANAEESGLIVPIGEWALRQACRQLRIWHDAGYRELKIAVNLSPRQLERSDFCGLVGQVLAETGIPATALELEITESILLQRSESNLATLTTLSGMGIALSVDDFGTGYSSLAYLQRFPVQALKIDQSFVRDVSIDQNDAALITAIIAMANSLHLKVIAEGVETWQQAQFLLEHGCLSAQGFYYSQALPAQALFDLLREGRGQTHRAQVH